MRRSLVRPRCEDHMPRPRRAMVRPRVIAAVRTRARADAATIPARGPRSAPWDRPSKPFAASPDPDDAAGPASWWSPGHATRRPPGGAPEAEKEGTMAASSDTPVLDLIGRMTLDSLEAASAL